MFSFFDEDPDAVFAVGVFFIVTTWICLAQAIVSAKAGNFDDWEIFCVLFCFLFGLFFFGHNFRCADAQQIQSVL